MGNREFVLNGWVQLFVISASIKRIIQMAEKIDGLRQKYQVDADMMASKRRFGYFSIPPSHTAARTDFSKTKCRKTDDGRVETAPRNVYSGSCSTGVLNKSYFSVPQSIYQGDPYTTKSTHSKPPKSPTCPPQTFKPCNLTKTLSTSAYKYICANPPDPNPKQHRNTDGSVLTKERNIFTNSMLKIGQEKLREFRYEGSFYENQRVMRNKEMLKSIVARKGDGPFKLGSPVKEFFSSNVEAFNDHEYKPKISKLTKKNSKQATHDSCFKPSCRPLNQPFSSPKYIQNSQITKATTHNESTGPQTCKNETNTKEEPFRLCKKAVNSKPSPSIAYSKMNLYRCLR